MSYQPSAPQYPYGAEQQHPPRRRKVWPWIVGALVLLAICGGLGVAMLGGAAAVVNEGVKAVESAEASRAADIKITGCKKDESIDLVTVTYTIVASATRQSYFPQFDIVGPDGEVIGSVGDITQELDPGATYRGKAVGTINVDVKKFTCRLASA